LYWKSKIFKERSKPLKVNPQRSLNILFSSNDAGKQSQTFPSSFIKQVEKILSKNFYCQLNMIGNSNIRMLSCLEAIQSADLIFTRSYHFAYWSLLLGKPVIAIPTSSKFNSFPSAYNKYLLFSSCAEILDFISSTNLSKIEEFVYGSSHQLNIHFYLQSVLLNLGASSTLYDKLKDNASYKIFASKYNELLELIPAKIFNEIGISFNRSSKSKVMDDPTSNDSPPLNISRLISIHAGPPSLAKNAINKSIHSFDYSSTDHKVIALSKIRDTLNCQAKNLSPSGYMDQFKHTLKIFLKFFLRRYKL
tara:strand:- start:12 stop:929 length:918 start_codon:yes stop_codon:yes gene_type:complete